MPLFEFVEPGQNMAETDSVGVEHGTAAPRGESVAVEVHYVDIGRAQGDAFTEQVRALVYQRKDASIDNFRCADSAPLDARLASGLLN